MINVIITEDDYRVAGIHEQFLTKINQFKVVGKAMNGNDTLELVENIDVDLLLLDIYMPDELGVDIIPRLRRLKPNIDIIIISAANDRAMVEKSLHCGIFDYIIKPVKLDRFLKTMEKYKETNSALSTSSEVNQSFLDNFFGLNSVSKTSQNIPKGIDPLTLKKIEGVLPQMKNGVTAEEMGIKIGVSRTTARRYLEYLISINRCIAELEYGSVGRPERKYYIYSHVN